MVTSVSLITRRRKFIGDSVTSNAGLSRGKFIGDSVTSNAGLSRGKFTSDSFTSNHVQVSLILLSCPRLFFSERFTRLLSAAGIGGPSTDDSLLSSSQWIHNLFCSRCRKKQFYLPLTSPISLSILVLAGSFIWPVAGITVIIFSSFYLFSFLVLFMSLHKLSCCMAFIAINLLLCFPYIHVYCCHHFRTDEMSKYAGRGREGKLASCKKLVSYALFQVAETTSKKKEDLVMS